METYRNYGRCNVNRCGKTATQYMTNNITEKVDLPHFPVGMAYTPIQKWGKLYEPDEALKAGTAFVDLNLVFCGVRRCK